MHQCNDKEMYDSLVSIDIGIGLFIVIITVFLLLLSQRYCTTASHVSMYVTKALSVLSLLFQVFRDRLFTVWKRQLE